MGKGSKGKGREDHPCLTKTKMKLTLNFKPPLLVIETENQSEVAFSF